MSDFAYTHYKNFNHSTFADAAYYNEDSEVMVIEAVNGEYLTYGDVAFHQWDAFINAPSAGRWYQSKIKGTNTYLGNTEYDFYVNVRDEAEKTPEPEVAATPGRKYTVLVEFDDFDKAYTLFSYAETLGVSASLSVEGKA